MRTPGLATSRFNDPKVRRNIQKLSVTCPYEAALMVYATEPCARTFQEDLDLHLRQGYVVSTPVAFIMGRPVERGSPMREIVDPAHVFAHPDAWFVYCAAGDLVSFFRHIPYPLPYIGWERHNVIRFYPFKDIEERTKYGYEKSIDRDCCPV